MPEDPADAHLTKLLVPASHVVPEKKAKEKATWTRKSSRRPVVSDSSPDDPKAPSASENEEEEEEEEEASPLQWGRKEKEGRPNWGGRRV